MVVIRDADRLVPIDGYLRIEVLRRLHRDTAIATTWPVSEIEALVHHRHLARPKRVALESAWLLGRLRARHDDGAAGAAAVPLDELGVAKTGSARGARRRGARPSPHGDRAGARGDEYLVPLARANKAQCAQLIAGLGDTRVSDRELGALYAAWRRADGAGRRRIVSEPLLVLRALATLGRRAT
ncbi:MAG TPA: hypothetical protein VHN14_15535 [Kofleriaceae bacterium]|nr:hypothetical protein [Kofleriaceae bacterium]